jgi:hypothetical protein
MLDHALILRHQAVANRSVYRADNRQYDGWKLSTLGDRPSLSGLPPFLRGDTLTEYEDRRTTTTAASYLRRSVDAIRPLDFEANIARRLGWKARNGQPTFIYWRHIPIARLVTSPNPHIFISTYHVGEQAQPTRALFAINPFLDYLMTGLRLSQKGISIARRHEIDPWPKTMRKPAILAHVAGQAPFWTVTEYELCKNDPVAFAGGADYPVPRPFEDGTTVASIDTDINGLI